MLRLTTCFLIAGLLFTIGFVLVPQSASTVTRLTNTPEQAVNLNPTLSNDGRIVVFESSADLDDDSSSFHAYQADVSGDASVFNSIASTRAVSPALSSDGRVVVFASAEDLVGKNADRNSEIFLFDGTKLSQVTQTKPESVESRLGDGCFQPSITADGHTIAFSSNRNFNALNADGSYEIFLYKDQEFTQLNKRAFRGESEDQR